MSYTNAKTIDVGIEEAAKRTRAALAEQGFGVLTEIDMAATMKKKLGEEIEPYLIFGACSPKHAFEALQGDPHVGAMLPCNVILRGVDGGTEVAAINPMVAMSAIESERVRAVAEEVDARLREVIASL